MKTNAMRILDKLKIEYEIFTYDPAKGISGKEVASSLNRPYDEIYKTLIITDGNSLFCCVIPVDNELNLKKVTKILGTKQLSMLPQKELLPKVGYVHGGCSPLGMKQKLKTLINISAKEKQYIIVSAGKIGMQLKIDPSILADIVDAEFFDIVK